ncbi:MAG: hypothetical protein ACRDV4_03775 [Acidimicrobiales bacterium]
MAGAIEFQSLPAGAPRVAVLTPVWGGRDETSWVIRQVAGALACSAEVHVITPGGNEPGLRGDGVFSVHELATVDPETEKRRGIILQAVRQSEPRGAGLRSQGTDTSAHLELRKLYDELSTELDDPWEGASEVIAAVQPDLLVLVDHRQLCALEALQRGAPEVPMMLLPVTHDLDTHDVAVFGPVFERSRVALCVTDSQHSAVRQLGGPGWARFVGLPVPVNSSVRREPNAFVGHTDYILVLSDSPMKTENPDPLRELLRLRFAPHRIAISGPDRFVVYQGGIRMHTEPAARPGSDLMRLIAWARVTVDLHPGRLIARECLNSMLYGTPVVVPSDSVARHHAELGSGGLWFDSASELLGCVETVLRPDVREVLGRQGQSYASERYGSSASFTERVRSAVTETAPSVVSALGSSDRSSMSTSTD